MADDDQVFNSVSIRIPMKRTERLSDARGDVEATFAQRHARPELPFEPELLGVVLICGWILERKFFVGDAIEETELLFAQENVFASIGDPRTGALHDSVGGLPCSHIRTHPQTNVWAFVAKARLEVLGQLLAGFLGLRMAAFG